MAGILKAPFPWFGGKSGIAPEVWAHLGHPKNYVEPFCGSAAMLLQCPHRVAVRTINDLDGFVANFWRSVALEPDAVAKSIDYPVTEIDLTARHLDLMRRRDGMAERLIIDPKYCDPEAAGWWAWGASTWIGTGWCGGDGPWKVVDGRLVNTSSGENGSRRKVPELGTDKGINRQMPELGSGNGKGINRDTGVSRQIPSLLMGGAAGINRQMPHIGNTGMGPNRPQYGGSVDERAESIRDYIARLCDVLRTVRVTCGDWRRVLTPSATTIHGVTGIFLDPPYGEGNQQYAAGGNDTADVSRDVWEWACANGDNKLLRIVVSGYEDGRPMPPGWTAQRWKAKKGYQLTDEAMLNSAREVIWISPHCVGGRQASLFDAE